MKSLLRVRILIIEFSPKEGKSIDSEASDLASGYVAMRAMGQNKNELLFSILDQVFSSLDIKKIFLTDSVQSAIEAEDSKVTMIVKLDSITQTDKNTIIKMLNLESYHYQKDDTFFKTLLHLSVACYWRDQTCGKSDRKVVFHELFFIEILKVIEWNIRIGKYLILDLFLIIKLAKMLRRCL